MTREFGFGASMLGALLVLLISPVLAAWAALVVLFAGVAAPIRVLLGDRISITTGDDDVKQLTVGDNGRGSKTLQ